MSYSADLIPSLPPDIECRTAAEVVQFALEILGESRVAVAVSFSAEDMVLLGLLNELRAHPRVFTIDTGRLPAATLALVDRSRNHFGIDVEVYQPDPARVSAMVEERGADLFYRSLDDRLWCCRVRRVEPLGRALEGSAGWITGLRREHTPARALTPKISADPAHGGWKIAPLADWTDKDVWRYVTEHELPYNPLYDRGYRSIGCDPCTRAVAAGDEPRSGRWWWETAGDGECGMHVQPGNIG